MKKIDKRGPERKKLSKGTWEIKKKNGEGVWEKSAEWQNGAEKNEIEMKNEIFLQFKVNENLFKQEEYALLNSVPVHIKNI